MPSSSPAWRSRWVSWTRNLWVVGGGNVASQLADAGLIDEVLVTVVPVILGAGKPMFDRPPPGGPCG